LTEEGFASASTAPLSSSTATIREFALIFDLPIGGEKPMVCNETLTG
jgi:hypothetical protein